MPRPGSTRTRPDGQWKETPKRPEAPGLWQLARALRAARDSSSVVQVSSPSPVRASARTAPTTPGPPQGQEVQRRPEHLLVALLVHTRAPPSARMSGPYGRRRNPA